MNNNRRWQHASLAVDGGTTEAMGDNWRTPKRWCARGGIVLRRAELQSGGTATVYIMGGISHPTYTRLWGSEVHMYDYKLLWTAGTSRGPCKRTADGSHLGENAEHIEPVRMVHRCSAPRGPQKNYNSEQGQLTRSYWLLALHYFELCKRPDNMELMSGIREASAEIALQNERKEGTGSLFLC